MGEVEETALVSVAGRDRHRDSFYPGAFGLR